MERPTTTLRRRTFLTTTGAALVCASLGGLVPQSEAAKRHPKRGGVLQFGTRLDAAGLDSHRNNQYHTSHPIAALYTGLTDIDQQGNIVPGVAESWEPNKELTCLDLPAAQRRAVSQRARGRCGGGEAEHSTHQRPRHWQQLAPWRGRKR